MLVFKGVLVFIDAGGKIIQMKLESHTHDPNTDGLTQEQVSCFFIFFNLDQ